MVKLEADDHLGRGLWNVAGSCNGLVCVHDFESFRIWNPATHQYGNIIHAGDDYKVDVGATGFAHVPSIDDYKIVRLSPILIESGDREIVVFLQIKVFSLRADEWTVDQRELDTDSLSIEHNSSCVVVDDIMYWPPRKGFSHMYGFDLVSDQLIKKPAPSIIGHYTQVHLFRYKWCLSFGGLKIMNDGCVCEVWTLKQHGDWNSWQQLFSMDCTEAFIYNFTETGDCLAEIFTSETSSLKLLVPTSKEISEQFRGEIELDFSVDDAWNYIESIASPSEPL